MISKKTLALEGIMKIQNYFNNRVGVLTKEEKESINAILDFITLPADMEWIPISKSVPKEKGEYLTTTIYGSVFCDYWDGDCFDRTETIIAWMKLPQPYKWEDNRNE